MSAPSSVSSSPAFSSSTSTQSAPPPAKAPAASPTPSSTLKAAHRDYDAKWTVTASASAKGGPSHSSAAPAPHPAAHLRLKVRPSIEGKKAEFLAIGNIEARLNWIRDNTNDFFEIIKQLPLAEKAAFVNCLPEDLFNLWVLLNQEDFRTIIDQHTPLDDAALAKDKNFGLRMCNDVERWGACLAKPGACGNVKSYFQHHKYHVRSDLSFRTKLCKKPREVCLPECPNVHIGDLVRQVLSSQQPAIERFLGIQTKYGPLATENSSASASAASPQPPKTPPAPAHAPASPPKPPSSPAGVVSGAATPRRAPASPVKPYTVTVVRFSASPQPSVLSRPGSVSPSVMMASSSQAPRTPEPHQPSSNSATPQPPRPATPAGQLRRLSISELSPAVVLTAPVGEPAAAVAPTKPAPNASSTNKTPSP